MTVKREVKREREVATLADCCEHIFSPTGVANEIRALTGMNKKEATKLATKFLTTELWFLHSEIVLAVCTYLRDYLATKGFDVNEDPE